MQVAGRIKVLRLRRDFSQQQVADFLGFSKMLVSKWERGSLRPTPLALERLATAFCIPEAAWGWQDERWDQVVVSVKPTIRPGSAEPLPEEPPALKPAPPAKAGRVVFQKCMGCRREFTPTMWPRTKYCPKCMEEA
jgi:transcriptional regulator with XRE-family HTH domain